MNILVCNDDGIYSEGLIALAKCLSRENNIIVIAPSGNMSGISHSLNFNQDIEVHEVFLDKAFKSYSVSGTPADCVKFAYYELKDFKIDLVCAGINKGSNLGTDVIYSGTVSAGLEANSLGLPAVAVSSVPFEGGDFDMCGIICLKIIDKFKEFFSSSYTLNVNVPGIKMNEIKGVKVAKLGVQVYSDQYIPTGENSYRLIGEPLEHGFNDSDCDVEWVKAGYVSVTPIVFDKTDYRAIEKIGKDFKI